MMEENKKGKKVETAINNFVGKVSVFGKKTVDEIKRNNEEKALKREEEKRQEKLKKLNPLFPEKYWDDNFKKPNIIMITDGVERRNEELCAGAIGWIDDRNNVEVMCLYEDFVNESKINFIPYPECNALYVVENFNHDRFLKIDIIFDKAHEEKIAELEHIAYSLGAKNCSIEIVETERSNDSSRNDSSMGGFGLIKGAKIKANVQSLSSNKKAESSSLNGTKITVFEGHDNPVKPMLKWFTHDDNINRLIEMRCKDPKSIKSQSLIIEGSSSRAISQIMAKKLDCAISKFGAKMEKSIESEFIKESSKKLVFEVEF